MRSFWRATLLYLALTIVVAYPLSMHPGTRVLSDSSDTDLFLWTLAWDSHAIAHQPWAIFDANIFHPFRHTLAFSENLIGSAVFAAPVIWVTGNVVLAMNIVALLSCVWCGAGTYLLARRSGIAEGGALVAGLVFAFAPPRFLRLDQLFLATIMWMPFALAFLQTYLDGGRPRDLRLAAGFFVLQALTSGHGAVFLLLAGLMLVAHRFAVEAPYTRIRRLPADLGVPGLLLAAAVLLLALPYRAVQAELGLRRSLDDWRVLHASSFLAAPTYAQEFLTSRILPHAHINDTADAYLFPGWTALFCAAWAMAARQARRRRPQPSLLWPIAAVAASAGACGAALVGALAASQGVFRLKVGSTVLVSARGGWRAWLVALACAGLRVAIAQVPNARRPVSRLAGRVAAWAAAWWADPLLPYAAFVVLGVWLAIGPPFSLWPYVYWLPGFNFVRVSSRFTLLGMLGLAVLAGAGFDAAATGLTRRMRAIAATVVCALVVLECLVPLGAVPYAIAVPEVDRWLATQPTPFAIAEVPLPDIRQPGLFNKFQSTYMLHSTVHWQKTVHGWSGLMPDTQLELFDALSRFPDRDSLQALRKVHVNYVVVHQDLYPQADWPDVERRLQFPAPGLTLVHTDPSGRVYALRPEP